MQGFDVPVEYPVSTPSFVCTCIQVNILTTIGQFMVHNMFFLFVNLRLTNCSQYPDFYVGAC